MQNRKKGDRRGFARAGGIPRDRALLARQPLARPRGLPLARACTTRPIPQDRADLRSLPTGAPHTSGARKTARPRYLASIRSDARLLPVEAPSRRGRNLLTFTSPNAASCTSGSTAPATGRTLSLPPSCLRTSMDWYARGVCMMPCSIFTASPRSPSAIPDHRRLSSMFSAVVRLTS